MQRKKTVLSLCDKLMAAAAESTLAYTTQVTRKKLSINTKDETDWPGMKIVAIREQNPYGKKKKKRPPSPHTKKLLSKHS